MYMSGACRGRDADRERERATLQVCVCVMAGAKGAVVRAQGFGATVYLVAFNVASCVGWGYLLYLLVRHLTVEGGSWTSVGLNPHIMFTLQVVQSSAILEVVHSLMGLVRSGAFTVLVQVVSRLFVTWGILALPFVSVSSSEFVTTLLVAWSLSEVIRYPFYAWSTLKLYGAVGEAPFVMAWLRYSGFLVLYPMGVLSEIALSLLALPMLYSTDYLSFSMPNTLNVSFSYTLFVSFSLLLYLPGFPFLFGTMLANRKSALSKYASPTKKTEKLA